MVNKGIVIGGIAAVIIVAIVATGLAQQSDIQTVNLTSNRTHGSISTGLGSPILGDPNAPVTIVEFGDYQCHQCYNWFHNTKPQLTTEYIDTGKVNLVFVDMAFLGRHSPIAAQASYCAEDQEMYWDYHNLMYTLQEDRIDGGWASKDRLKAFAFTLGLDTELFNSCLDSGKYHQRVQFNTSQSRSFGVTGTPTFAIVHEDQELRIGGAQPYFAFRDAIESLI